MRVAIVPKAELTVEQARCIGERVRLHPLDRGPSTVWETYANGLYGVVNQDTSQPIGVIESSGPPDQRGAGWWLDSPYRGRGLGNAMVDALAMRLKSEGVTGIGKIVIDTYLGEYSAASARLAQRLKAHFPKR